MRPSERKVPQVCESFVRMRTVSAARRGGRISGTKSGVSDIHRLDYGETNVSIFSNSVPRVRDRGVFISGVSHVILPLFKLLSVIVVLKVNEKDVYVFQGDYKNSNDPVLWGTWPFLRLSPVGSHRHHSHAHRLCSIDERTERRQSGYRLWHTKTLSTQTGRY